MNHCVLSPHHFKENHGYKWPTAQMNRIHFKYLNNLLCNIKMASISVVFSMDPAISYLWKFAPCKKKRKIKSHLHLSPMFGLLSQERLLSYWKLLTDHFEFHCRLLETRVSLYVFLICSCTIQTSANFWETRIIRKFACEHTLFWWIYCFLWKYCKLLKPQILQGLHL